MSKKFGVVNLPTEAENAASNKRYSQALYDMLVHGMYVERDGVRIDPNDFFIERPESVEE